MCKQKASLQEQEARVTKELKMSMKKAQELHEALRSRDADHLNRIDEMHRQHGRPHCFNPLTAFRGDYRSAEAEAIRVSWAGIQNHWC